MSNFITETLSKMKRPEIVRDGSVIGINPGGLFVFGQDPRQSENFNPTVRSVQLAEGILKPLQLSRAAFEIEMSKDGQLIARRLTPNNTVRIVEMNESDGMWTPKNIEVDVLVILNPYACVEVITADKSLLRFTQTGGDGINDQGFRVDVKPSKRDLNEP